MAYTAIAAKSLGICFKIQQHCTKNIAWQKIQFKTYVFEIYDFRKLGVKGKGEGFQSIFTGKANSLLGIRKGSPLKKSSLCGNSSLGYPCS